MEPITRIEKYLSKILGSLGDLQGLITLSDSITAEDFAETLTLMKELMEPRVTSLNSTPLNDRVVHAAGSLTFVDKSKFSLYPDFTLTDPGWYVFARIAAKPGVDASSAVVTGAADYNAAEDHVDVAVRFDVAAVSTSIEVAWGEDAGTETFAFDASDQAIIGLDYRVTFYVYDAADYVTWSYALTTDTTFAEGKTYYAKVGSEYTEAEVTAGEAVPADTYYNHSKITIEGLPRNVTYRLDEIIDCPMEFILPEIDDDTHGCWFEIRCRHAGEYSMTLVPPSPDIKIATEHTQKETAGINMINLHYTVIDDVKIWRFLNTHSSIPE